MGGDPSIPAGVATGGASTAAVLGANLEDTLNQKIPTVQVALPGGQEAQGAFVHWMRDHTTVEAVRSVPVVGGFLEQYFVLPKLYRQAIQGLAFVDRQVLGIGIDAAETALGACQDAQGSNAPCRRLDAKSTQTWAGHNQELIDWSVRLAEVTAGWLVGGTVLKSTGASLRARGLRYSPVTLSRIHTLFGSHFLPLALMGYLFDSKVLATPEKFLQLFDINGALGGQTEQLRIYASVTEMALALLYIAHEYAAPANAQVPNPLNRGQRIAAPRISMWTSILIGLAYAAYYTLSENSAFQEATDTRIYGKPPRESFGDFFNVTEWHWHVFSFAFAVSLFGTWAGTAKGWALVSGLSGKINNPLYRVEAGVAELFGHARRMIFNPPTIAAADTWFARSARGLWEFFRLPAMGYTFQRPQIPRPDLGSWWRAGRDGAATYRAASMVPGSFVERLRGHIREHFHLSPERNAFAAILQQQPYLVENRFTRQVAEWNRVTALERAATNARLAANLNPGIAELATRASELEVAATAGRATVPKAPWVTEAYYRSVAGVSVRSIGSAMGTWNILRSPKRLSFTAQHALIVASVSVLGVLIMESSRGIPDDVADRIAARSLINIVPNFPFRYGYAAAGVPISNWDFYMGNMTTTTPMISMGAQQESYAVKKAPEYIGAMHTASDAGAMARNFLYAAQAFAIANPAQPGEWKSLSDRERVALMLYDAPVSEGMMALFAVASHWKQGAPLTPEEVDQFPQVMADRGFLTADQLAAMRFNMRQASPETFHAALPRELTDVYAAAVAHRQTIDTRKRQLGIK